MTSFKPDEDEEAEPAGIQIDVFGMKVRVKPSELKHQEPTTWREVAGRVHASLKRTAVGIARLVEEVVEGSIRIVRGVTSLPGSISERVASAHEHADRAEDRRQAAAPPTAPAQLSGPSVSEATAAQAAALEGILKEKLAEGHFVAIRQLDDGQWAVIVVKAALAEQAEQLAKLTSQHLKDDTMPQSQTPPR
jgi:hypothetical protein